MRERVVVDGSWFATRGGFRSRFACESEDGTIDDLNDLEYFLFPRTTLQSFDQQCIFSTKRIPITYRTERARRYISYLGEMRYYNPSYPK